MPAMNRDAMGASRGPARRRARRVAAALTAGICLTMLASTTPGAADEIDERKDRVDRDIDRTEEHLDQSSARLLDSNRRLAEAATALDGARATLAQTRGELAAAQAFDRQMQIELADAVGDLSRARAALARGRATVSDREEVLRSIAVNQYASGGAELMVLSTVFNSQDTSQLTSQLNSYKSVLDTESATIARLEASQVLLTVQESQYKQAKQEVAERRAAAAENLERKAALESQAQQTEARIQDLVVVRSEARQVAAAAKTEDLRQLRQLESEKAEVSALLRARAEEARRQAEAETRARAEAEAQARAEAHARAEAREAAPSKDRAKAPQPRPVAPSAPAPASAPASAPAPAPAPVDEGLRYPVNGYITSSYGMRLHPVYKRWALHDGTDFGASCGTPIYAAASGTVIATYFNVGYGNRIIIDHGYKRGVGLGTSYNHLSGYSTSVGEQVQKGEVIGYVGTTGYSTGCHLHFMVFENGATVDPMRWL